LSKAILLIGSYTETLSDELTGRGHGILVAEFDPINGTISIKSAHFVRNPSYLTIGAKNSVYAVSELPKGDASTVAFLLNADRSLHFLNARKVQGGYPCHLTYHHELNCILAACYGTGHLILHQVAADGQIQSAQHLIRHTGKSIDLKRQQSAHPHMVLIEGNRIFVPDLGIDQIRCYEVTKNEKKYELVEASRVTVPKGSGPRHVVIHPGKKHLFILNELKATISVIRCGNEDLTYLSSFPILPPESNASNGASAIRIAPDGRFIYASDRVNNGIAIISFDSQKESMERVSFCSTHGRNPRDIQLSPCGNWLLAANMDTDCITVFAVDKASGLLSVQDQFIGIISPSCLCWLSGS